MTQEQFNAQMRKFNEELTALNTPIRAKQQEYESKMGEVREEKDKANAEIDSNRRIIAEMQEELHRHNESKPTGEGQEAELAVWKVEHEELRQRLYAQDRHTMELRDRYNQHKLRLTQVRNAWYELERLRKANATMIWEKQHAFILANPKDQMEAA